jgi:hypothetical protein
MIDDDLRDRFVRDGYVLFPAGVVPSSLLFEARRAINARLATGISPAEAGEFADGICFPELSSSPAISRLYTESGLPALLTALCGPMAPGECRGGGGCVRACAQTPRV